MKAKIADLIVEIPEAGDLVPRCKDYRLLSIRDNDVTNRVDIILSDNRFHIENYPFLSKDDAIYLESGWQFYCHLLKYCGLMLHSSAVELDGKAYLFSGPCGTGKSTHTRLWQQIFGEKAQVFNDDKPALRCLDGKWYAYGTPWCGKDGINQNKKVPLAGICFLKQAPENKIRRLSQAEAIQRIISQTMRRFKLMENTDLMLSHVGKLVRQIPVFELENRPEPEAALLSYETMRKAAEELGL